MRHANTFAEWYGLRPIAGRVCAALYAADTRPLTVAVLTGRLNHNRHSIYAALVSLRAAVEHGAIVSDGLRYAFTEAGMDDCNAAIADAKARRAAA